MVYLCCIHLNVVFPNCPRWVTCPVCTVHGANVWLSDAANAWPAYGVVRDSATSTPGHATHSCTTAWQWVLASRQMGEGDGGNSNEVNLLFPLGASPVGTILLTAHQSFSRKKNPSTVCVCVPSSQQSWGRVGKQILRENKKPNCLADEPQQLMIWLISFFPSPCDLRGSCYILAGAIQVALPAHINFFSIF